MIAKIVIAALDTEKAIFVETSLTIIKGKTMTARVKKTIEIIVNDIPIILFQVVTCLTLSIIKYVLAKENKPILLTRVGTRYTGITWFLANSTFINEI